MIEAIDLEEKIINYMRNPLEKHHLRGWRGILNPKKEIIEELGFESFLEKMFSCNSLFHFQK